MADTGEEAGKGLRFIVTGLAATATHYIALMALVELLGGRPVGLMNLFAAALGVAVSYFGNHHFVFRSARPQRDTVGRFLGVYGLTTVSHGALMGAWADLAGLPTTPGFLAVTAFTAAANFIIGRFWIFEDQPTGSKPSGFEE